jgi:hypothetical protein
VNQGSTYAVSLQQGILWSPDDVTKMHWRHMREARVGDLVIHYAKGIRALSVVTADARPWSRPEGFDEGWQGAGLMVRVDYRALDRPIELSDVPLALRSDEVPGGAFDRRHAVKLGYLWAATQELWDWIIARADLPGIDGGAQTSGGEEDGADGTPSGQGHRYQGELDLDVTTTARGEQKSLRQFLFGDAAVAECALCGRLLPVSLLRAAHIKRRSACTDDELRDFRAVAMPACVLGCDAFFELGWVAVDEQGTIEAVGELNEDAQAARSAIVGRRCKAHSEWTSSYFAWHRGAIRDGCRKLTSGGASQSLDGRGLDVIDRGAGPS